MGGAVGGPHRSEATKIEGPIRGTIDGAATDCSAIATTSAKRTGPAACRARVATSKRLTRSAADTRSPGSAMPIEAARAARSAAASMPWAASSDSVIAPSRLVRRWPSDADDQRHVGVTRHRQAEGLPDGDLARCRRKQVVATSDEVDAGRSVVDDDREVVGGHAVVAAQDDVGRHPVEPSGHDVVDDDVAAIGTEADGGRPLRSRVRRVGGR